MHTSFGLSQILGQIMIGLKLTAAWLRPECGTWVGVNTSLTGL